MTTILKTHKYRKTLPRLTSLLACCALFSCASYTKIPQPDRGEISIAVEGKLLWLKQSLFVGQFYDDDRFELLHSRHFDELTYLRTLEGETIFPPPETGIVPAGTRVRVETIAWPTSKTVFDRPLYTPRYTTWVYLRVGRDRGETQFERPKKHILLIPGGIPDRDTFTQWFDTYFTEDDPNQWISQLPPQQRDGVLQKHPVVGMDYESLTAAMGYPDRIVREQQESGATSQTVEVAIFGATSVVLQDSIVTRVRTPAHENASSDALPPKAPAEPQDATHTQTQTDHEGSHTVSQPSPETSDALPATDSKKPTQEDSQDEPDLNDPLMP